MLVLALESAVEGFSVALVHDGVLLEQLGDARTRQTENILPAIHTLLTRHNIALSRLDLVAFGQGPGAFGGLRVSVAITQALAWLHDLPVLGVSTLAALGLHASRELGVEAVLSVLDARMNEVYVAGHVFGSSGFPDVRLADALYPYHTSLTDLASEAFPDYPVQNIALCGTGTDACMDANSFFLHSPVHAPLATDIAELAQRSIEAGVKPGTAKTAQPVYLRENAWKTLEQQAQAKR